MPDIDFGQISESLNNKSDRDLRNVDTTAKADAVIDYQEPTSANNYTWYRKYKSGWVEQGGYKTPVSSETHYQITLPIQMSDSNYVILTTLRNNNTTGSGFVNVDNTKGVTATAFWFWITNKVNAGCLPVGVYWQVSGMAAN